MSKGRRIYSKKFGVYVPDNWTEVSGICFIAFKDLETKVIRFFGLNDISNTKTDLFTKGRCVGLSSDFNDLL